MLFPSWVDTDRYIDRQLFQERFESRGGYMLNSGASLELDRDRDRQLQRQPDGQRQCFFGARWRQTGTETETATETATDTATETDAKTG